MKTPEEARVQLRKRFASKHKAWLRSAGDDKWPLEIALGIPSETEATKDVDAVGEWARQWHDWPGIGQVIWSDRRWKNLGRQSLPERLSLRSPMEVAASVGQSVRWNRAVVRYREMLVRWPVLRDVLSSHFTVLADYSAADFERLAQMLNWLESNPGSNLYPRQIPVAGLDSKWLETRTQVITGLLCAIHGTEASAQNFYEHCGLRLPPPLVRVRILDDGLRRSVGRLSDISAPLADLALGDLRPKRVFIVENLQTGLAFPDLPGAVVVMGMGYSVDLLAALSWIPDVAQFYWGDIDTHGFAILNRARNHLPALQSILMDEQTLMLHRTLWGREPEPSSAQALSHLTHDEQSVFAALKTDRWGEQVRLEQERVSWDYAMAKLREISGG